jgi:UDP-3-O-acyl-N-acetylglucosamine deacetylase
MQIETNPRNLRDIKAGRHPGILPVPDHFRDDSLNLRADRRYNLARPVEIRGVASFENRRMRIQMRSRRGAFPTIGCGGLNLPVLAEHAVKGEHNIQLGEVKIIEHVLAMTTALNLDVDFLLSRQSFPTFDYCNRPFLNAARSVFQDAGPVRHITVRRPFAGIFASSNQKPGLSRGYFMLEPDQGERALIMDHQISYPGQAVGNQRIVVRMDPNFFSYICDARTTSFRPETRRIYWLTRLGIARLKYPVTTRNILFADAEKIYNPRTKFDAGGVNYEFICHELMDVMAWIKFLEVAYAGKFVGRLTTHFFDHHRQVDAARYVCQSPDFARRIGITGA